MLIVNRAFSRLNLSRSYRQPLVRLQRQYTMPARTADNMDTSAHPVQKSESNGTTALKGAGGRDLPELYKSTGNEAKDTLAFLHLLEKLKLEKRSGWIREGVKQVESIADHMCRMALIAMTIPSTAERPLDISKCVMMALVHDLAEAYVGDITPVERIPASVKHELEGKAMDSFMNEMLGGPNNKHARERIRSLWEEYEARETPEAKLVKDLDRLELVLQASEYERAQNNDQLSCFFRGSIPYLEHPTVRAMAESAMQERKEYWESRGKGEWEQENLRGATVGSKVDEAKAKASQSSDQA